MRINVSRVARVFAPGFAVVVSLATVLAVISGCSSANAPTPGTKRVEGFQRTKAALADAQRQVDATLAALGFLRATGGQGSTANLSDAFKSYRAAVADLEKEGKNAKRRAEAMQEDVDTYILAWQKEMDQIKDPAIKASVQQRKDAVRSNFKLLRMYAEDARKAYEPFLRNNKDVVQALSIDLSPAAMNGLASAMDRTQASGEALKQRITAFQHALGNIERGMSPIGDTSSAH